MKPFAWYVINRHTKYIIAGFGDAADAHHYVDSLKHNEYVVLSYFEVAA